MRTVLIAVLVLAIATPSFGWLFGIDDLIGGIFDFFATTADNLLGISTNVLGSIFLDPLKIFQADTDTDHGHSLGMVQQCPALADVIFVMDASGSMSQNDFLKGINFNRRITEHFKIGPDNVRFGAVVFSDNAQEIFGLDDFYDHKSIAEALRRTPYLAKGTSTWKALELIKNNRMFDNRWASKIVVLITDGQSSSITSTTGAASALKSSGVEIIVVGIGSGLSFELSSVASGSKNHFSPRTFNDLLRVEQSIAKRICEIPAEAGFDPPKYKPVCPVGHKSVGGSCVDIDECSSGLSTCEQNCVNAIGGYRCTCNSGFEVNAFDSSKCDAVQACQALADIIFVIDASGSMGYDNFETQIYFASKLVNHFAVGTNNVQFGGILFGSTVQKLFDLKDFSTASDISKALKAAPYLKGSTYTHLALGNLQENLNMFGSAAGGRSNAEDIVILLTDGVSSRPSMTEYAADKLKSNNVRIITVGIGADVDTDEIQKIASTPEDAFQVASFELLTYIEQHLTERACATA